MDRPPNPTVHAVLRDASLRELLKLREVAVQGQLWRLARAADREIIRRCEQHLRRHLHSAPDR